MSELEQLLEAVAAAEGAGEEAVLATVVKVEGSAYRRPGARMLINTLGQTAGTVSGGCLETEVARTAWWLTERGPALRSYSTAEDAEDGEAAVRFGLGCNGTVHLLFERISSPACQLLLASARDLVAPQGGAMATVVGPAHSGLLGQRLLLDGAGRTVGSLPASLQAPLQSLLLQARDAPRASLHQFEQSGGQVLEVLLEPLRPARRLVIFGGGHDAQPLVSMARLQGLHVTLIDSRAHFARAARFPDAHAVLQGDLQQPDALLPLLDDAAVVIMTHSLQQDACWLDLAVRSAASYIGQLGPRERTERLLAGVQRPLPAQLHYPVGLDLGGDTPQSVALAVLAEITAVAHQRQGGKLQQRRTAIHDPVPIERHARVVSPSLSEKY